MKKIISITMIVLFANLLQAQNNYENAWDKVTNYESKGLPKSALAEVELIYNKAKLANNSVQVIKTILFKSKYALTLEEDAKLKIITNIKAEIVKAKTPEKNVLESVLAKLYQQYFDKNRYTFYNRSHTAKKVDATDFRTWDLHTIFQEIHKHHQNAMQDALLLQQQPLDKLNAILHLQKGSKNVRPTVYDFIAHNALKFYKTGESNLAQPANKFELDNPDLLAGNTTFAKANFITKDSLSQKLEALRILKNLTLFHKKNIDKTALLDVTLKRLDFVKEHAIFKDKNEGYFATLKGLEAEYKKNPLGTEISYRLALYYEQQAKKYASKKEEKYQFLLQNAVSICEKAIAEFPESRGAQKCANLKHRIQATYIVIKNESIVEVAKETRLFITYKNANKLYFKIYKAPTNLELDLNKMYNKEEKLSKLKKLELVTSFSRALKNENDYQLHTTEVILPKLVQGEYVILASKNGDFMNENSFSYSFIQASNLVLVLNKTDNKYRFQVVNRFSGKPLQGAKLHLENHNINRYNTKINTTLYSDKDGFVTYVATDNHNQVEIVIDHKGDKGVFKNYRIQKQNRHWNTNDTYQTNKIFLFTDRSIYRPSQTVYFKGIAVAQKNNKSSVISNKKVIVTLKDANYQEVKTLELQTNEFGSFAGEFILPNLGLTGDFQIHVQGVQSFIEKLPFIGKERLNGYHSISVEEYKRPKFEVKFSKITDTFKINDSVKVKGIATAYAGSTITDAKVVYRVKRNVQYPRWWYWYRPYGTTSKAQEITHGETTTNAKGEFEITFFAQPDKSVAEKDTPVFSYEITANITDINGETRSASTIVRVGYHAQTLHIAVADKLDKGNKKNTITIDSKNLNGEFVATKGTLKIYKIKAPKQVLRNRPWGLPDYQEIPQDTFEKLFPHDVFKKVAPSDEKGALIFTANFDTNKTKEISLGKMKSWVSGKYIAIAKSNDRFKKQIIDKSQFAVFSKKDKQVADKQLIAITLDKTEYQVGEEAMLTIGSASKDITIVVNIEKKNKIVDTRVIQLNNEIKTICIPVTKADLGGFSVAYHLVNFNSFIQGNLLIAVPYTKKELEIETLTFRDKLQPGAEETWSFKIKGSKKDKAIAEILTSMYDASLDQFKQHQWQFNPIYYQTYYPSVSSNATKSFGTKQFRSYQNVPQNTHIKYQGYDMMNWFGLQFGYANFGYGVEYDMMESGAVLEEIVIRGAPTKGNKSIRKHKKTARPNAALSQNLQGSSSSLSVTNISPNKEVSKTRVDFSSIKLRTNFNETAFFFPQLKTDSSGNVSFSFTTPESLTKWKLQLVAHTKDLQSATKILETVTQKELMVLPNLPRFLRQGDEIVISSKIANLTDKVLNGNAQLQLIDAITNKAIDIDLGNALKTKSFRVNAKGNANVSWTLHIPENIQAVQYKIVAKAGNFSDGEQNVLPVLTNRMLVTETMPMWIRSKQTKTFTLDKLASTNSSTRKNHKLTLEVTANPAWYAVQALPYLMEYPYECAEQTFSRYYANTLASYIANSNPLIQQVFNQWKSSDALLSNLEKNQELKSLMIQETPWLRDAQSETEQKKRIALLFDLNKMKNEQEKAVKKLKQMQMSSGGFPWFKGSRYENRYITQHIVAGFGHLDKLNALGKKETRGQTQDMLVKAINYLDNQILKDYAKLLNNAEKRFANDTNKEQKIKEYLAKNHTNHFQVHYLYARSFFKDVEIPNKLKIAVAYYTKQSYTYWQDYNLFSKGLIALVAYRNDNNAIADAILVSLKENAITSDELGMYWKSNTSSYYWYQAPIETHALLIEAFSEIEKDTTTIDNLKIWLLKNKQTNRWKTTKATTEAVYALLLQGSDWITTTKFVDITIGNKTIKPLELENTKVEAGTGYFKTAWNGNEITPEMAKVTIKKEGNGIAWGALYWQYFEDLDKITFAETPLKLTKKLFLKTNEFRGEKITLITKETKLTLGDLVRVRIELKVDRAMEFIHMKDMRAAGFEPVNVLSRYKWQDGLGYYESTKDASTNFFFDRLPKGVYVFEYDLRVNNMGDFSNGITTIQSMYAPEFSSHSEGIRVKIVE